MTRLVNIKRWPAIGVFILAGCSAVAFAFSTVNLFTYTMASVAFIKKFGWEAVRNGALWQVAELSLWGSVSLFLWLVFKIAEADLSRRYLNWAERDQGDNSRM